MLVFASPKTQGSYRGFAYDAIAIAYYNDDVKFGLLCVLE